MIFAFHFLGQQKPYHGEGTLDISKEEDLNIASKRIEFAISYTRYIVAYARTILSAERRLLKHICCSFLFFIEMQLVLLSILQFQFGFPIAGAEFWLAVLPNFEQRMNQIVRHHCVQGDRLR